MRDSADALRDGHRSSAATADDAQSGLVGRSARSIDAASVNVTDQVVAR